MLLDYFFSSAPSASPRYPSPFESCLDFSL
jgi:hypothetical protein